MVSALCGSLVRPESGRASRCGGVATAAGALLNTNASGGGSGLSSSGPAGQAQPRLMGVSVPGSRSGTRTGAPAAATRFAIWPEVKAVEAGTSYPAAVSSWLPRAMAAVEDGRSEMFDLLSTLVRIPSVTGTDIEHDALATTADWLRRNGLEVDHWPVDLDGLTADPQFPGLEAPRSEAWGLVGRLPGRGDGPTLMFNGHIDVVPAGQSSSWQGGRAFSAEVRRGALHGRGSCDMKGGLVAALWAVAALRRCGAPLRGDLLMACVQSEEDGGLGTFATLRRGWRADACVVPEPTSLDLVTAAAGALTFRIRITGKAAHASRHLEGVSAMGKLWPVWRALQDLERERNAVVDPLFSRWEIPYPLCIGTVTSGVWASSVPDLLVAEGRLGVALGEPVEEARAALEGAVDAACDLDPWLREHPVVVEWWGGQFASGHLPAGSDLAGRVAAAHRVASGGPQSTWGAPYGSDLRLLAAEGVPTLHYGPGDAGLAHGPDESVPLAEVATAARTLTALALDACGVA